VVHEGLDTSGDHHTVKCVILRTRLLEVGTESTLLPTISVVTGIYTSVLAGGDLKAFSRCSKNVMVVKTPDEQDGRYCLLSDGTLQCSYADDLWGGKACFHPAPGGYHEMSDDHTIFAWNPGWSSNHNRGLLAPSPEFFADSGHLFTPCIWVARISLVTNRGINLKLPLQALLGTKGQYLAVLNCEQQARAATCLRFR